MGRSAANRRKPAKGGRMKRDIGFYIGIFIGCIIGNILAKWIIWLIETRLATL